MSIEMITGYFENYGAIAIFVIVLLEYLNLPGFPAGVIMPMAGIWAANGKLSFLMTMVISVAAGLAWKLDFIFFWKIWRRCVFKGICEEISQTKASNRPELSDDTAKRMSGNFYQQADPHGADFDFDSGRSASYRLYEIYGQFCSWNLHLEFFLCGSRICTGGQGV